MKILFILENYYPYIGGVETLFKTLCEALAKDNISVTVLTNKFSVDLKNKEDINNVKIIRLPFRNRYLFTFLAGFAAIKHARKHDLIHTTSYNAGIPSFIAGFLTRTKTIITFHEVWGKLWFKLPFMNKIVLTFHFLFEWFLLRLPFHKFIAVSDFTADSLIDAGINKSKIIRIYNGIDYNDFANFTKVKSDKFTFTYFGRLGISKGLDILLNAIEILKAQNKTFDFNLIIPTLPASFNDKIRGLIAQKNLSEIISIHSDLSRNILFNKVANSSAVVIPSYSEGFCYTAVESMALNVPIVTSNMGALKEVVSGKYVKMKNYSAQSLADAMQRALEGKWETIPLKKFQLKTTINEYIQFYKQLLNRTNA